MFFVILDALPNLQIISIPQTNLSQVCEAFFTPVVVQNLLQKDWGLNLVLQKPVLFWVNSTTTNCYNRASGYKMPYRSSFF